MGNPGSVGDGQVLLLVKLLASPLGACNGAHKDMFRVTPSSHEVDNGFLESQLPAQPSPPGRVYSSLPIKHSDQKAAAPIHLVGVRGHKMLWGGKGGMTGQGCQGWA